MPGRLGPRFAIEALFLIALAAGAAYADLDARWIALIMGAGWVVVALLELTAERIWATAPPWRRPKYFAAPLAPPADELPEPVVSAAAVVEPEVEVAAAVAPEPAVPEPVAVPEPEPEAATVIAPAAPAVPVEDGERKLEPEPAGEVEPEPEPEPAAEEPARPTLEPLQARPRRRWFRRGERTDPHEAPPPEVPKHVRLLPAPTQPTRTPEELAEGP
jgi:hypothetical protein